MSKSYYYAVTRVHSQELGLLSAEDIQALIDAKDLDAALDFLKNKGWGHSDLAEGDVHELLNYETQKIWDLMQELVGEIEPFKVFRYQHDFNNLKAAIKLAHTHRDKPHGEDTLRYFMPFGTLSPERLIDAAIDRSYESLPPPLNAVGQQADDALARTGSGQYCDIIVDKAALETMYTTGMESGNRLLEEYVTLKVDAANINIAVRSARMNKGIDFLKLALANGGSLDALGLADAAASSEDDIYHYLESTRYNEAIPLLRQSMAAFERWADNLLIHEIRPFRYEIGGLEPLAGFIVARENEIDMVRLVLSAKINHLEPEKVEERRRDMYV